MSATGLTFELLSLPHEAGRNSSLAAALQSGELALPGFQLWTSAPSSAPPQERFEPVERAALSARLERCLAPLRPHVAVLDAIRSLREPGACLVVTGQQPGLCASPLLSLYKALQAIRLARLLRQAWERPVVAMFWNHADDHDVAEVHHTWIQNENLDLQRVGLAGLSSGRQPVGRIALHDEQHGLSALRAQLEQALAQRSTDPVKRAQAQRAIDLFLPRPKETLATAFTRTMTALLGHLGLVVLEPEWMREELSRALARLVTCDAQAQLDAGTRALREAGFEPGIEPEQAALLYALDEGGRRALRSGGDGYRYDGEAGSRSAVELAAEIVQDLGAWSPGALFRPIVQDLCLPVAAYVGGAGELAYHVQLPALRRAASAPLTPFVLRRSCTLVEPECAESLRRLGVSVPDALSGELESLSATADPGRPEILARLRQTGERAAEELLALREELARLDRALAQNVARTAGQVRSLVDKLAEKGERVHDNSSGKGRRHVRRLVNALRPRGEPQERVLGPLPFVARFGRDWIDALFGELDPFEPRHLAAVFPAEPAPGDAGSAALQPEDQP
jgi:bacillithiol biosynthesis cysteine-adding enzyme BshC